MRFTLARISVAVVVAVTAACRSGNKAAPWDELPLAFDTYIHDIQFLDAANGWVVGGGHFVEGGLIARTTDGGTTWTVRTNVVPRGRGGTEYYLRSVHFVDAERGWISGDAGRILRTDDGGESWKPQLVPSGTRVLDVFFLDRDRGWAVTWSQTLLLTTDGGDTWSRVEPQPGLGDCWAIQFLDNQNGVAVGGGIVYSSDGGHRWQQAEAPDVDYWAVDFPSVGAGWAVGARGTILHTTDGGRSWRAQTSGVTGPLRDVRFGDDRRGWVVGAIPGSDKSVILFTDDAGATWTQQQEVPGLQLLTITATDAGHAWTAGRRPSVEGPQTMLRLSP